ncbi:MAG: nucleoside triphosphate pyrophosphohydrolase [Rhodobacterales bacterium]|nr:MAG: nucleoside triphosphate pyrophosphohydrolase [Rhodobacterales bacterium]
MSDPIHTRPADLPRLLEIMRRLRDPETGCPWDIEQDFRSIAPYTIEEAYEVSDAIEREAWDELRGELGDLLLQVVYHGQMAEEAGLFSFDDIAADIGDKMIARHPHVFGDENRDKSAAQQVEDWEAIKARERAGKAERGVLDGVALGLPALLRAHKLQKRLSRVGFDWPDVDGALAKLREEIGELAEARAERSQDAIEDELGDVLFAVANVARHLDCEPEAALRRANAKVERRWSFIERALAEKGIAPREASLDELEALWQAAKRDNS